MQISYIDTTDELTEVVQKLQQTERIAIDLEFDRNRYRYGFNMCLMQVYDGSSTYLIDPLSEKIDISTSFSVFEDSGISKVVFAFGEDLRLFHSLGCFPKNISDLDIVSSLLNYPPSSLDNLLQKVLDIEPGRSSQQSNWYKRPLSDKQKKYAASDVYHLLELNETLMNEAEREGIKDWVLQENALHDHLDYSQENHNNMIKEKDKKEQSEFSWYVYTQLMEFFDTVACENNKPVYHLVSKDLIKKIAGNPSEVDRWQNTRGIYRKLKSNTFFKRLKTFLNQAVEEANNKGLAKNKPAIKRLNKDEYKEIKKERNRIGQIKSAVFKPLQKHMIDQLGKHTKSFILPNRLVSELIQGNADTLPSYKKKLLLEYADQIDVDVSPFI
ncbi:MAG: ribonuclease D [Balneolaceae bacterium]|nr:ribonuclease D [Balneolaceae bacterium]